MVRAPSIIVAENQILAAPCPISDDRAARQRRHAHRSIGRGVCRVPRDLNPYVSEEGAEPTAYANALSAVFVLGGRS